MNNLQIFNSPDFGQIRTIQQNGEPWFVGKDVAKILGYERADNAIRCSKCGKKLAKICDCWLMKRPYHCNFQKCPDMSAFTLLLLHIQQDQKRRKYVFLAPILEAINSKSLKTVKKLSVDQRSITRLGSFNNDVWYKIY